MNLREGAGAFCRCAGPFGDNGDNARCMLDPVHASQSGAGTKTLSFLPTGGKPPLPTRLAASSKRTCACPKATGHAWAATKLERLFIATSLTPQRHRSAAQKSPLTVGSKGSSGAFAKDGVRRRSLPRPHPPSRLRSGLRPSPSLRGPLPRPLRPRLRCGVTAVLLLLPG